MTAEDCDGLLVDPIAGRFGELELLNATVAEICKAAGYYPPFNPDADDRASECEYERTVMEHDVLHFSSARLGDSDHPWRFQTYIIKASVLCVCVRFGMFVRLRSCWCFCATDRSARIQCLSKQRLNSKLGQRPNNIGETYSEP